MQMQLQGERLYLLCLQDSFSEGKLSTFSLGSADHPSYIDLKGNLHINLQMHPEALSKVQQPCILNIRGRWNKPTYGLQF
jgi:hypothetical protein